MNVTDLKTLVPRLVEIANQNNSTMTGDMAEVWEIVNTHSIVFTIWQDYTKPHGVDLMVVKGSKLLMETVQNNRPLTVQITAIKCLDVNQAYALAHMIGENDPRH